MKIKIWGRGVGTRGGLNEVGVSSSGEVLVRAFDYSDFLFQTIDTVDTAFNFFKPKQGFQFVITGVVISGNRDIGVNGSILTVYTADSTTSTTALSTPFEIEVPKSTVLPFIIPNVLTAEGIFLNGKADDATVRVGMFGYFVPKIE